MGKILSLLIFSMSLSIDSFGIGMAYGMKNISIPILSRLFMSLMSFFCSFLSIMLGSFIYTILPPVIGVIISAIILFVLGIYMMLSAVRNLKKENLKQSKNVKKSRKILSLFIRSFGISITIIKHPSCGDIDKSNSIDFKEAIYIGLAMSLDSMGAGIGYSISGTYAGFLPLFAAISQFLFLSMGKLLGDRITKLSFINENILSFIPGAVMIFIAVMRIIQI